MNEFLKQLGISNYIYDETTSTLCATDEGYYQIRSLISLMDNLDDKGIDYEVKDGFDIEVKPQSDSSPT
jgi:hypothetical protein